MSDSPVWFITGASRGFGLALTRAALAAGDRVVATARRPQTVEAELGAEDRLLVAALDVTDTAAAEAAVAAAVDRFGRIDVLVNNAGYGLLGALEETSDAEGRALFDVNVFGLLNVTRAALPQLRAQGAGRIVNIGSVAGIAAGGGSPLYSASKYAVEGISEAQRAELEPLGILTTVVEPGVFRTDFLDPSSLALAARSIPAYAESDRRGWAEAENGRQVGDPDKAAAAIIELVRSDDPPLRLPLGADCVARVEAKLERLQTELGAWRAVATGTDVAGVSAEPATFRVGVGRDVRASERAAVHDLALELLDAAPGVSWEFLPEHSLELAPETIRGYDAVMLWGAGGVSARTLAGADRLKLIARFGMGLDAIDLDACGERGILVTVAPDAVGTAVPAGAMAFVLALAHRLPQKDRLVRSGRWNDAFGQIGLGTSGRVLGVIGVGNIGAALLRMAEPFGFRLLSFDPHSHTRQHPVPAGVEPVDLETLLRSSDFVCVTCPLTDRTRGLIDRRRLALMPAHAYLVNVARGPIVDSRAVADAVREKRLAGAALDVFENEPIEPDHPLLGLDEVILSPHAIAYTEAAFRSLGTTACEAVLAVSRGETPDNVANP